MASERELRILIVDDRREVARVLRTSLELLNRGYRITDVPSGEEAMLEMGRVPYDLLITDYRLPGMTGIELIERIRRRTPDVKAIIITGNPISDVRRELGEVEVLGVFEKPLDISNFTALVDTTLLGEEKVEQLASTQTDISLIPEFDKQTAGRELRGLTGDLGCKAIALVHRSGKVALKDGTLEESLRFSELAVLLANNFTTTTEIGTYLGERSSGAVHYYTGNWHDIYALSVGTGFFLTVVFSGESQKQMGLVLRYGKPAAERLAVLIEGAPIPVPAEPVLKKPATGPLRGTGRLKPETVETAERSKRKRRDQEREPEPPVEEEIAPIAFADLLPADGGQAAALDLNFEELDVDLDDLGNLESFWDEATSDERAAGADSISLDEAMELGLVPKDLEE